MVQEVLVRPGAFAPTLAPVDTGPTLFDARAVGAGALLAIAVALPAAIAAQVVAGDSAGPPAVVLSVVALAGLSFGGFRAARRAPAGPLANGAVAALAAFGAIQGLGIVRRLATGDALPDPAGLAFAGLLACSCGLVGAVASRRRETVERPADGRGTP